jgi:hypothetical protein
MIQSWQESPRLMFSMPVDRWVIQGQQPSLPEFIRKGDAVKTPIEHHLEKPNEVGQIKPDQFKPELSSHSDAINREVMNRPAPSPMFRPDIPHLDREPVPILRQERIDVWRNNIKPEGVRPEILKPERPDIPRERR